MDYGLLNFLGITAMMIFGLWAFHRGYKNVKKEKFRRIGKTGNPSPHN